ncbi:hypothetical protein NIES2101_41305 [Calothrix sp. HK-06]|nr:hypothetical protein NIES2101_41305 [Calothrix sp. HK-06]
MDTQEDFVFLNDRVAEKFNPYQEGEYLVVQTRSGWRLHPLHRGFDYRAANKFCEMENLGSDYSHYSVRVVHQGKLHCVDWEGAATKPSKEQDWKIHEEYYNARYKDNLDCEIETCDCSYPVFWNYGTRILNGEASEVWRPITCLVEDHGREIDNCPNCNTRLGNSPEDEEDEEYWDDMPPVCEGCRYYYSADNSIVCAVHPQGPDDDYICSDWEQYS